MVMLWAAAAFFLGIHLIIAGTPLRDRLTGVMGEGPYRGLFSLLSLVGIVWLCWSYNLAVTGPNELHWVTPDGLKHLAPLLVLLAFLIGVIGLTTPNPTSVGAEGLMEKPGTVHGVLRITRHPFLWSVIIWGLTHIAMNGDTASIIFFGTFTLLAALGTLSIDAKRKRLYGESWKGFAASTSNLPFGAIFAGRNRLAVGELGWWRILAALIAFGAIFYAHLWLFGVTPVPGWYPY